MCDKPEEENGSSAPIAEKDTTDGSVLSRRKRNATDVPPRTNTGADGKEQEEFV